MHAAALLGPRWPGAGVSDGCRDGCRVNVRPRPCTRSAPSPLPSLQCGVGLCCFEGANPFFLFCAPRVKCTFILAKQKQKVTVPGMIGWTLLETAKHHNLPVNGSPADTPWDYNTFGEGPASVEDHVVVAQEYWEMCLPMGYQEKDLLEMAERFQQPMCAVASGLPAAALVRVSPKPNPNLNPNASGRLWRAGPVQWARAQLRTPCRTPAARPAACAPGRGWRHASR